MRALLTIFYCLLILFASANKIDELQTDDEVERFALKQNEKLKDIVSFPILYYGAGNTKADSLGVKNWLKTDMNGDGLTDIIINTSQHIENFGNHTFFIAFIDRGTYFEFVCFQKEIYDAQNAFPVFTAIDGKLGVIIHFEKRHYRSHDIKTSVDTFVYQAPGFVEYNATPKNYTIKSLKYFVGPCYGSCPVYTVDIDNNGCVVLKERGFKGRVMGTFKMKLSTNRLNEIKALLNYIDIAVASNDPGLIITDVSLCTLEVAYDDKVRKIEDYAYYSTASLLTVYNIFYVLRTEMIPAAKLKRWEKHRDIK